MVKSGSEAAIMESGPASCVDEYIERASASLDGASLTSVMVSHIHVDHSGGAWKAVKRLPSIKVMVYEKGAKYLLDPSKLVESAKAALGDIYHVWGDVEPVPGDAVVPLKAGSSVNVGSKTLVLVDAPGHAPHSSVWYLEDDRTLFCGDALGIYVADERGGYIWPTTPPPSFDYELAVSTISRLSQFKVECMCFPHYHYSCDASAAFDAIEQAYADWRRITSEAYAAGLSPEDTLVRILDEAPKYASVSADPYRRSLMLMDIRGMMNYYSRRLSSKRQPG